jgi:hypothetical protein
MDKLEWKKVGVVGVDSGSVMICDPTYIDSEWENEDYVTGSKNNGKFSFNGCCQATIKKNFGQLKFSKGRKGVGVVSNSGYGDGCYDVFALISDEGKWGKRVKELKIVFF